MKIQVIQGIIDAAAAKTTAKLGVFFENLATGETAGVNVDEIFPTASVYTPAGDFILSLFYNGNVASEEEYNANAKGRLGDELLAELSRDVCNAFMA